MLGASGVAPLGSHLRGLTHVALPVPALKRSVRLREWQSRALQSFEAHSGREFLAVATPGAGKTTFALVAALRQLAKAAPGTRLVVVTPTAHLKLQWERAAFGLGLHLDPAWAAGDGSLPADMHGVVMTYQQVAHHHRKLKRLLRGSFAVLDEVHHAATDRIWGEAISHALADAARILSLSGTPFRSDSAAMPFVNYHDGEAVADYEHGYGDALEEGRVVRPVYFPRTNGHMEWRASDGTTHSATFDDALDTVRANQRLRTALSPEGEWLPEVLRAADERLSELRRSHPRSAGLVIAMDQAHARAIAAHLRAQLGKEAVVVTSDDPLASTRIARFATSTEPWLVAVRMVSEGVDIPRLRVAVYATTTTTELFFRQAVGRVVRWEQGHPDQRAYLFIPDDPRLRAHAAKIAERRRHCLAPKKPETSPVERYERETSAVDEQPSLFSVISAVATDSVMHSSDRGPNSEERDLSEKEDDPSLVVEVAAPPMTQSLAQAPDLAEASRSGRKAELRKANAELAKNIARRTGWAHSQVNAELNRLAGVQRIADATLVQLERRRQHAQKWLSRC